MIRVLGCLLLGLVWACLHPALASAAETAHATSPAQTQSTPRDETPTREALEDPRLFVGLDGRIVSRETRSGAPAEYGTSLQWTAHGTIVLARWLGFRTSGGMERVSVELRDGALGVPGSVTTTPTLRGPRVVVELEPRWAVLPRLDLFATLGAAWQRFTLAPLSMSDPTPLSISQRSGVLVEYPLHLGVSYQVLPRLVSVSLTAGILVTGSQTGALFDSRAGANQSVRQDTGELVRVSALPEFGNAFSTGISLDLLL